MESNHITDVSAETSDDRQIFSSEYKINVTPQSPLYGRGKNATVTGVW